MCADDVTSLSSRCTDETQRGTEHDPFEVLNALENEASRFTVIFDRNYFKLLAYCQRHIGQIADAEEIAESTFLYAWNHISEAPEGIESYVWLVGIARRVLSNFWRGKERQERLRVRLRNDLHITDLSQVVDVSAPVLQAFRKLRESERETLALVAWDGFSHSEAAKVLGCTTHAFDLRLHRAKIALRNELDGVRHPV